MKRFGLADMLSYVLIAGTGVCQVCRHQQNTRFFGASRRTCVRIQQGSECLAEFAFRNAFRHQLLKCLASIRRHGFAMHLEGDRRTCTCGYSAGAGRSTCVQTALHGAYETVRHGRDAFIAPHRESRHWSGSRSSAKHGVLRNKRGMQPHRYGNTSRSGAGAAGARLDWLCGRRALHSQRLLVLQQKMLDTGVFCLVYLGLLNRRRPVHSRLNPKADFGNATVTGLQTPCQQCSVLPAV